VGSNTFKLGTYGTEAEAKRCVSSARVMAAQLRPRSYSFDISRGSRGWVVCVSGSRPDVIVFQNAWSK